MRSDDGSDTSSFGVLVRQRRQAKSLSQEALAATALGNADRKSFISAVENNRLAKITPATAQRLCAALGIARDEIPAGLRWPIVDVDRDIERRVQALEEDVAALPDRRTIAQFINAQLAGSVGQSVADRYHAQLQSGLDAIQRWTGRPFSLQSLLVSYAICLVYVVAAALLSFGGGAITVGAVNLLSATAWESSAWAARTPLLTLLFVIGSALACWLILFRFGRSDMGNGEKILRLATAAFMAGVSCGVAAYLGADSLAVAVMFAVPCFAAVSTLRPYAAMLAGAAGGVVAGLAAPVSAFFQPTENADFALALIEGLVIGSVIGSIAGWASSKTRLGIPHLGGGQVAGAGAGIACGSMLCLGAIMVASTMGAAETTTLGVFAVVWLALPLANALLDYLSLGVSHAIARLIRNRRPGGGIIALLAVLDLSVALILMVLSVTMIGVALALISATLGVDTLGLLFLETSVSDPWGQGLWLTLMVLTTCIWTWLHFAGAVAPLTAGLLARRVEQLAKSKLDAAEEGGTIAISAGAFIWLRYPIFYVVWAFLALFPALVILTNPTIISGLLQLGLQQARLLLVG